MEQRYALTNSHHLRPPPPKTKCLGVNIKTLGDATVAAGVGGHGRDIFDWLNHRDNLQPHGTVSHVVRLWWRRYYCCFCFGVCTLRDSLGSSSQLIQLPCKMKRPNLLLLLRSSLPMFGGLIDWCVTRLTTLWGTGTTLQPWYM